jgi:toxin FitB
MSEVAVDAMRNRCDTSRRSAKITACASARLTDTNVISELMRREPDVGVQAWAAAQSGFHLSAITAEELSFGLTRKPLPLKRQWLDTFLSRHGRILPVTKEIAEAAGRLRGRLSAVGQHRTAADMLIAARALLHRLPLATRNVADFAGCGVEIVSPFAP